VLSLGDLEGYVRVVTKKNGSIRVCIIWVYIDLYMIPCVRGSNPLPALHHQSHPFSLFVGG
jgi:hypothetical protein